MNTTNTLNICRSNAEKEMAKGISLCFKKHYKEPVLFLVSGGSALKVLDFIDIGSMGPDVIVSVLDERLDVDKEESNFFGLSGTQFYKKTRDKGVVFIPMQEWPTVLVSRVVITTMGIGLDGHTAGIMPFPESADKFKELFENEGKIITNYDAGSKNKYPHRLTATLSFLKNRVDYAFVYVAGEEKKLILETILNRVGSMSKYPALVIYEMKQVGLYTAI